MNYIVPLTFSSGTSSLWVESQPGKKDFQALELVPGRCIKFNGNELTHGSKVNETKLTRVSFDFRVLPIEFYDEFHNKESMTQKRKFTIGNYYKLFKK